MEVCNVYVINYYRSMEPLGNCAVSYLSAFNMGGSLPHTAVPHPLQGDMWDLCWWGKTGYWSSGAHIWWTTRRHKLQFHRQSDWVQWRSSVLYWLSVCKNLHRRYYNKGVVTYNHQISTTFQLSPLRSSTVTGGHVSSIPQLERGALHPAKWANYWLYCEVLCNLCCWQRCTAIQVS